MNSLIPPTIEKVQGLIDKLTEGAGTIVKKEKYNEDGILCEMEIQIVEIDTEGNIKQFDYLRRDGRVTLDEVSFDGEGMPIGGKQVAEYKGGNWEMVGE